MQVQGTTAWCGLCALNNAAGSEVFDVKMLDTLADEAWLNIFDEIGSSMLDVYAPMRSIDGNYSIEVLLRAANNKGYKMNYGNNEVCLFLKKCSSSYFPSLSAALGSNTFNSPPYHSTLLNSTV